MSKINKVNFDGAYLRSSSGHFFNETDNTTTMQRLISKGWTFLPEDLQVERARGIKQTCQKLFPIFIMISTITRISIIIIMIINIITFIIIMLPFIIIIQVCEGAVTKETKTLVQVTLFCSRKSGQLQIKGKVFPKVGTIHPSHILGSHIRSATEWGGLWIAPKTQRRNISLANIPTTKICGKGNNGKRYVKISFIILWHHYRNDIISDLLKPHNFRFVKMESWNFDRGQRWRLAIPRLEEVLPWKWKIHPPFIIIEKLFSHHTYGYHDYHNNYVHH